MRELSDQERALRDERRGRLERLLAERMPVLTDLFQRLGHDDAALVLVEAERFLDSLDGFLTDAEIGDDDRAWVLARVAYFLGELFAQRHGGVWLLDEDPDSPHFLRFVVGGFTEGADPQARFDPFAVAASYVDQPPPRSLRDVIAALESELGATSPS